MGRGWLLSSLLHMAVAVLLWFGLPSWGRTLPAADGAITVELVSEAAGPPEPAVAALAPEPEREAARPEPRPPAPPPEPEPEPRPEPAAAPPEEPPPPAPEPQVMEPPPPPVAEPARPPAPPPEPQVARPAPEPPPEPAPVSPPEQHAALPPEPRPEPAPRPRPEPPPKPQVQPKPRPKPAPPQTATKPAPPPPEPTPPAPEPPKQDEFAALLRSVEEMDRRREGEVEREGTGRSRDAAGQARSELGEARLSIGEIDALMRQIGRCWTLPAGIDGIEDMVVRLRIQVRPDRSVLGVTIEDQGRLNRDPTFRAVAESARRAVDRCSPLNLPADKYALWREIVMNFFPEYAIGG
jgi:hypothetical protein